MGWKFKKVAITAFRENSRLELLEQTKEDYALNGWEFVEYKDNGFSSYARFKIKLEDRQKKASTNMSFKKILLITIFILILFIILMIVIGTNSEDSNDNIKNDNIKINSITVSDNANTLYRRQAVTITLLQDNVDWISLSIQKNVIKKGYEYDSKKRKNFNHPIDISSVFNDKRYNYTDNKYDLKIRFKEYNKIAKKAVIVINTTLTNADNEDDTMVLKNIKVVLEGKNFTLLTKKFKIKKNNKQCNEKKKIFYMDKKQMNLMVKIKLTKRKNICGNIWNILSDERDIHTYCSKKIFINTKERKALDTWYRYCNLK